MQIADLTGDKVFDKVEDKVKDKSPSRTGQERSVFNTAVEVSIEGETVQVKELRFADALKLYGDIQEIAKRVMTETGELKLSVESIMEMVNANLDLAMELVMKCTGKTREWLDARSVGEVLAIAEEAVVLNVGIILGRLKNAQGRLQAIMKPAEGSVRALTGQGLTEGSETRP